MLTGETFYVVLRQGIYVFQKDAYEDQIDRAAKNIRNTDCVIIGAGAGASTAAGIQYGGKRFTDNFAEFIKKIR